MNATDIIAEFHLRRAHYDTYLEANNIPIHTCPGCAFPTLQADTTTCIICNREDNQQDITATRIDIGRILESNIDLKNGEIDFHTPNVLQTIAFYQQRKAEIASRFTGEEFQQDHIWIEYNEVKKDLLMALVVPKL